MEEIIEDANRFGWIYLLPLGNKLIQESETRCGTFNYVAERFLKASDYFFSFFDSHMGLSVQTAYKNLKNRILVGRNRISGNRGCI